MTKAQHTPGPWTAHKLDSGLIAVNNNQREQHIVQTVYDTPEQEANARLIAAAPELLEALEMLLPYVEAGRDAAAIKAKEFARTAITKATA